MKIKGLSFPSYINVNKTKKLPNFASYLAINMNSIDTVSFSAKANKIPKKENHVKNGVKIGKDVYEMLQAGNSQKEIISKLQQISPNLEIKDVQNLTQYYIDPTYYTAYFLSHIGENFVPENMQMFLKLDESLESNEDKLLRAMDIAHEFTHYSQVSSGEDYEIWKKISNNDKDYAGLITGIGDCVFSTFDTILKDDYTQFAFSQSPFTSKFIPIPQSRYISKQEMFNSSKIKNEAAFSKYVNSLYDSIYIKLFERMVDGSQKVEDSLLIQLEDLAKQGKLDKLKDDVKKYCSQVARKEKEARTAESELAKKILKQTGSINYDIYPLFYELLEKAFK